MGRLLLCAALLCLVIGATSEPNYVVSVPASLISGDPGKACVNIIGSTERLAVSLVLEHNRRNVSIIAEDVESSKYFQCGDFTVPAATEAVPVAIIFSATGANTDLRERKTVVINSASISCMYQMDKPIYRSGQKVRWRLLCLDAQLKPVKQPLTMMYVQGPGRTRIAQWPKPELENGVVSGELQLVPDAPLGSYVITTERESGYPIRQYFQVEEYVAPRFSVTVDSPQTISVTDESINVKASAMYIYGEPVPGSVTIRYCMQPQYYGRRQNCFKDKGDTCSYMTGELSADGTYSGVIDLESGPVRSRGRSFTMDVTVTEAGTGIQVTESRYTWVTTQPASLSFDYDSMNEYYKRGIGYSFGATLKNERGEPMPDQEIEIQIDNGDSKKAMTDSDGRITYAIDTSNMVKPNITITISYLNPDQCYYSEWSKTDYPTTEHTVYRAYSYSGSFIQARRTKGELSCGQDYKIDVDYIISPEGEMKTATFYYLVMSKSAIVWNGQKDVDISSSRNGTFSLDLSVSYEMAPRADLIIYSVLQKEMITDVINLNIEKCFKNQISMTFSDDTIAPGSKIEAQLSAAPNSYCALRVIDSSLLILNPYEQFSADRVYNSRRTYYYGYNVAGFDVEDPPPPCEDPDEMVFCNGRYYLPKSSQTEGDSYKAVKSVGLVVAANCILRKPEVCDKNPAEQNIIPLADKGSGSGFGGGANAVAKFASLEMDGAPRAAPVESVRTDFSEGFMWVIVPLDTEGHGSVSDTLPDSITTWQGSAFCTSEESGFGMTRTTANVTTILPFFFELSGIYSCIRHEVIRMKGVARNNMDKYIRVNANLQGTTDYDATLTDGQQDVCIPPGGHAAFTWEVKPKSLGEIPFTGSSETTHIGSSCDGPNDPSQSPRKDTVVPTIIVEPEGINQELTESNLVFVQDKNVQLPISITPPDNVVPDSAKAYVTVVADIFGLAVQNLDDLVKKPYGCGDQNLGRFCAIPPILDYLNVTGQLTEEILQKAKGYMTEGYQRHLSYISGGAYGLFPTSRQVNSILTAETFNCFERIKKYIFVDETQQQQTLIWMENSQKLENGCFRAEGKPVTNNEGDTDLQYTATVAAALLESNYSLGHTLLNGAMECLRNASKSEQKISEQALMLYAFTLANDEEYRKPLLEKLMKKAKTQGGIIHWEREDMPELLKVPFFFPPYPSSEVWITSYMLLSMAKNPNITPEDLPLIAQTSVWLARQENSNGGFPATRDTKVAIQALAAVAQHLHVPNAQQTVTIRKNDADVATIDLSQHNRLVVQRHVLPEASGDYIIDVTGKGWSLIQTTVGYNIPVPKENSAFALSIAASSANCINGVAYQINLNCSLSYQGSRDETGPVLFTIKMLSGYIPNYSSLAKLKNDKAIAKFEITPKGEILLYLEDVPKQPVQINFESLAGPRVSNMQDASASVYSIYENSENGFASYSNPCAEHNRVSS